MNSAKTVQISTDEIRTSLQMRQLAVLMDQSTLALVGSLVAGVVAFMIFWQVSSRSISIIWFVVLLSQSALRIVLLHGYSVTHKASINPRRWLLLNDATLCLSGLVWSIGAIYLPPADNATYVSVSIMCICGLVAGGVGTLSAHCRSALAFGTAAILPFAGHLLATRQSQGLFLAGSMLLFLLLLAVISVRVQAMFITQFELADENEALALTTKVEREELERLNQELEQRVDRRTTEMNQTVDDLAAEVDQRRRALEALEEQEERFRRAFEDAPFGMSMCDQDGILVKSNDAAAKMIGYTLSELTGQEFRRLVHPDDAQPASESLQAVLSNTDEVQMLELRLMHKKGYLVWGEISISPIMDESGSVMYVMIQSRDISKEKDLDKNVESATERFQTAIVQAPIGIAFLDSAGRIVDVNHALCRMLERAESDLKGITFEGITHKDDAEQARSTMQSFMAGGLAETVIHRRLLNRSDESVATKSTLSLIDDAKTAKSSIIVFIERATPSGH